MSGPAVSDFAGDAPIHTDDNALLEFSTPRTMIANVGEKSFFETIARHHRPDLSFLTGRDPQALAALKGQAERGMRARGHAMLGLALILQKHTDQGQALLAHAADLNPSDPVLNSVLDNQLAQAAALIQRRQVAEAAGACEKILSLNPRHAGAHFMLGRLLRQQGQANLALEHFCQAADAAPQDLRAAYAAAMMAGDLGKVDLAVRYYRRTLQLKDDHAEAMISLAWALLSDPTSSAANAPEAVHLAKRACRLTANNDPKAFDALGVAHAALGNFTDARSAAAQALALAEQAGNPRLIEAFQKRLDLYTSNLRNPTSRERP